MDAHPQEKAIPPPVPLLECVPREANFSLPASRQGWLGLHKGSRPEEARAAQIPPRQPRGRGILWRACRRTLQNRLIKTPKSSFPRVRRCFSTAPAGPKCSVPTDHQLQRGAPLSLALKNPALSVCSRAVKKQAKRKLQNMLCGHGPGFPSALFLWFLMDLPLRMGQ